MFKLFERDKSDLKFIPPLIAKSVNEIVKYLRKLFCREN